jgi:signal peptidase I
VKRIRLRPSLFTAAFLLAVAAAWFYFAPTQVGGSTRYVVTAGTSMEPRIHTGDLGIVRPARQYKVGDIAAYWSTMLHTVVLHRIHAIHGSTYVFKGDNNDFLDPVHPTRAELLGQLWLHVPRGGVWLNRIHSPAGVAIIVALVASVGLLGVGEHKRRRRKRRRTGASGSLRPRMPLVNTSPNQSVGRHTNFGAFLTASAVAAAVFVVLGMIAFTRPAARTTAATTPYMQRVTFGYSAHAPRSPVYPTGALKTGDPIFLSQVHQIGVHLNYGFVSTAPHGVAGTEEVRLRLTAQSGWSRSFVLAPSTRFTGDHTSTVVTLDIPQIQSLVDKVATLTGMPPQSYSIAVAPRVHITGTIAGHPLNLNFSPAMSFQLSGAQLIAQSATDAASASGDSSATGASSPNLKVSRDGSVGTPATASATITVLGVSPQISLLRWISSLGMLLSAAAAAYFYLRRRGEPFEESVRIQSQYGHMIVPIVGGEDLGWPPVDVASIKSLVKLAEAGQRLILHNRSNNVDTYMVNEEGTVYRYQVKASNVVWGEWSEAGTGVKAAA